MLFNSISFAVFLPIVFFIHWFFTKSVRSQNILLLLSSYFFYSCWDWRFLFLLLFSTLLDYFIGLKMSESIHKKKWFWLSIIVNLGFLGIFKYYNFFTESFAKLVSSFGFNSHPSTLNLILPIGISFYTFHGLSYVIDIYKNRIKPEKNFVDYALFVSFFPLLVAGPIERATHLLPQLKSQRIFDYSKAVDGMRQILWGLFKKIVIADNCAELANSIFNNSSTFSGSTLFFGAVFFSFQIYGDFSGYSDIALGSARLFGVELLQNFSYPYFSRDIAEFWRRWHISLSSWFKDYVYIPLGGSRVTTSKKIRNIFVIFILSGFWHGANWTFIIWGLLNALFIIPSIILTTNRTNFEIVAKGKSFPTLKEFSSILITFILTTFIWIFFRSESLEFALNYISKIFSSSFFTVPKFAELDKVLITIAFVCIFILIEWSGRESKYAISKLGLKWNRYLRHGMYYAIVFSIFWFCGKSEQFIYFQF